ncbi:MAG: ASKHA domain-containing protein [candidate division KSB1 bacterium]|nr:ASKHA domain-containing protein [candidate division KSB1 bacterium]
MPIIYLKPLNQSIEVSKGTPLIDVLNEFAVAFPCGGRGTCGGCKVRILDGSIPVDPGHQKRLDELGLSNDWRLACLSRVEADVTLLVDQWRHLILADQSDFEFEPRPGTGIAVDVGTTTLVAQLIDLQTAEIKAAATDVNPQSRFGADIMSRVEYAVRQDSALLTRLIRAKVYDLILRLLEQKYTADRIVLVGNTVMHHLFCGYDLSPLSMYPFESPHSGQVNLTPEDLDWQLEGDPTIAFMACIGGFVGSDILAGILASGMHKSNAISCLIDLGTNGEIAVGNRKKILCASTAAGPAFEGINISCGMQAATGALASLQFKDEQLTYHVIGDTDSLRGICGSGLLDAVSGLLESGQLDEWGQLTNGQDRVEVIPGLSLTQNDIRQVQLAKGAVAAGLQILSGKRCGSLDAVDQFYIAGAFGNYLNLNSARRIGLVDAEPDRVRTLGNSALLGAKIMLYMEEAQIQSILHAIQHLSLETDADFQETFAMKMLF